MCGIFGFITTSGRGPELHRLKRIAEETQSRGVHAFGLAWIADEEIHVFKRPGSASADPNDLNRCRGAKVVIGHCRYATHGDPRDNRNNHPHAAGSGYFVHNGVVVNHADLTWRHRLVQRTQCDSEVLGLLLAKTSGKLISRAARVARMATGPLAILGIWRNPMRLVIVRNGNPLCFGETEDGFYFGSLPGELPGQAASLVDRYAGVLTFTGDDLLVEGFEF
jgi:glucosamine--fructose-6-phosphate aminotransferase (isomerizing)